MLLALPAIAGAGITRVDLLAPLGLQVNAAGPLLVRMDAAAQPAGGGQHPQLIGHAHRLPQPLRAQHRRRHARAAVPEVGSAGHRFAQRQRLCHRPTAPWKWCSPIPDARAPSRRERSSRWWPWTKPTAMPSWSAGRAATWHGRPEERPDPLHPAGAKRKKAPQNLNQTPPPPMRKVVCDSAARRVAAVDGHSATLHRFSADDLQPRQAGCWPSSPEAAGISPATPPATGHPAGGGDSGAQGHPGGKDRGSPAADDVIVPLARVQRGRGHRLRRGAGRDYSSPTTTIPACTWSISRTTGISEIKLPAYGNDATALDANHGHALRSQLGLRRDRPGRPEDPAACAGAFSSPLSCRTCSTWPSTPTTASCTCRWAPRRSTARSGPPSPFSTREAASWKRCAPAGRRRNCCGSPAAMHSSSFDNEDQLARVAPDGNVHAP